MSEDYLDCVWIGDQAIVFGYDKDGSFRKKELTGFEMERLAVLEARQNAALQKLLAELMA